MDRGLDCGERRLGGSVGRTYLEWTGDWSVGNEGLVGGSVVPDLEWTGDWCVGNAGLVDESVVPDLE